jgi:Ferritin-like domain
MSVARLDLGGIDPSGAVAEAADRAGGLSRGAFIGRAGLVAGAAVGLAAAPAGAQAGADDAAILNFALSLEYLQAAFYSEAERRRALGSESAKAARTIGAVERAHVAALRDALGRKAMKRPFFDFRGTTEDDEVFIRTAVAFEDFSAAAYQGALTRLTARELVAAAASIHTVESRHAAWIRFLQGVQPASRPIDAAISAREAQQLVAQTRFVRPRPRTAARGAPRFTG